MLLRRNVLLVVALVALGTALYTPTPQAVASVDVDEKLRARITDAVQKAVEFLRKQHRNGAWTHLGFSPDGRLSPHDIGATAMVAVALLESDVAPNDPLVQRAVGHVKSNLQNVTLTYTLAAAILLLDRAGGSANSGAINGIANRLVQGQNRKRGGWGYDCPPKIDAVDNSNTQFAIIALLIARRHGANVDAALKLAEQRFRQTQHTDGGWSYLAETPEQTTGSMTCTGLLALLIGFNVKNTKPRDAKFTGGAAGSGTGAPAPQPIAREAVSAFLKDPAVLRGRDYILGRLQRAAPHTEHLTYFLWSLERVCQVYGWTRLGDMDWYAHGCELLLREQQKDGSWELDHRHGKPCDTAFALLFLRKSNLVPELNMDVIFRGGGDVRKLDVPKPTSPASGAPATGSARPKGTEKEARELARELPDSVDPRTTEIIEKLVETSGEWYTDALLEVLNNPNTKPTVKARTREGLAQRLARFKATTVAGYLKSPDREAKLAACQALRIKHRNGQDVKPALEDLIDALASTSGTDVTQAAYATLKEVTGKDFGPTPGSWKRWLADNP
jgi:hypothetical protein